MTYNLHFISNSILAVFLIVSTVQAEELNSTISKGQQEFIDNCSLCHGDTAKGDGYFSSMLTLPTSDLTKLSKNNNGIFPYKSVYLTIDGTEKIKSHGSHQMPIWGDRFKMTTWYTINQKYADTLVRGKIFELVLYLESIQE